MAAPDFPPPPPSTPPSLAPLDNALGRETSPYLLQHKDNPVHWQPWGPATLARAAAEGKPILLSVGYAACHWCHVMAHESFEDDETAAVMNRLFVNIKVDREERPDIDSIYQSALALLGQHGGWPLTMFLSPDGGPFWGGTYFPPDARYGRPGFRAMLHRVAEVYHQDPEAVRQNRDALLDALGRLSAPSPDASGPALSLRLLDQLAERLAEEVDTTHGGVGKAPKFPHTGVLELLWRAYLRTGQARYRDLVVFSLDCMCQGGIYDHLGGGFARYATDDAWLVPHFEKMLYDNAQLIELLTLVWQDTGSPLHAARIAETVDWVLREMVAEGGGFASSLDADSEGEEGRFYVWTESEVDALLGPGPATGAFKAAYDVRPTGNWEGHTILHRNHRPALGDAAAEAALAGQRQMLLAARAGRIRPGWDDKVLADWNGLMIRALAFAGSVFGRPDWLAAAARAFTFVHRQMTHDGRLLHAARAGRAQHTALLDDYANMAAAALALFEATGDTAYPAAAEAWVAVLDRHYWDAAHGGYFFTADDAEALITRTRSATDAAVPAGNGTIIEVLARLFWLTGQDAYRQRADAVLAALGGQVGRNFFPLATLLNNFETLAHGLQVVIVGRPDDSATRQLADTVRARSLPGRLLTIMAPGATLPGGHPAAGKTQVDGLATAFVCRGTTCSLPVTDADQLAALLRPPRRPDADAPAFAP